MKKILQCITLSESGGAQSVVYSIIKGTHAEYQTILACAPGGELVDMASQIGAKVYELNTMVRNFSPINDIKTLVQLIKIMKKEKPDIIHCHSFKAGVLGRIAAFFSRVPLTIYTVHGWSKLYSKSKLVKYIYIFIEKLLGFITDKLICVSNEDVEIGVKYGIAPSRKFNVAYNGIKLGNASYEGEKIEQQEFPLDRVVIGTVARMATQKRVFETIDIMHRVFKKYENIYYIWVGDGPLFEQAKNYVKYVDISDRFILAGNKTNVHDYLNNFDVYMLLSNYEGLSISILEAMSAGLPVVASNVGGVKEQIMHGTSGYIVSDDYEDIEEKIEELILDKNKRKSFGEKGRELFLSKFTVDKMIEAYKKIYS